LTFTDLSRLQRNGARGVEDSMLRRQTIEQTMERLPQGVRRLAVQLRTPIGVDLLWSVLTDYDRLSSFIPNLSSSTLEARQGNRVELAQVGSQQLLGLRFSAAVQLELVEHRPEGLLQFRMLKGDFRRFEGSWRLQSLPDGTSLLYDLTVQGCLGMPVALIEQRLRSDLSANLLAVEREAQRRIQVDN
jgi:ribosome-associated toxin RatA of RatAB toxin-antitoxin module